jgi:hypothetical protein
MCRMPYCTLYRVKIGGFSRPSGAGYFPLGVEQQAAGLGQGFKATAGDLFQEVRW